MPQYRTNTEETPTPLTRASWACCCPRQQQPSDTRLSRGAPVDAPEAVECNKGFKPPCPHADAGSSSAQSPPERCSWCTRRPPAACGTHCSPRCRHSHASRCPPCRTCRCTWSAARSPSSSPASSAKSHTHAVLTSDTGLLGALGHHGDWETAWLEPM